MVAEKRKNCKKNHITLIYCFWGLGRELLKDRGELGLRWYPLFLVYIFFHRYIASFLWLSSCYSMTDSLYLGLLLKTTWTCLFLPFFLIWNFLTAHLLRWSRPGIVKADCCPRAKSALPLFYECRFTGTQLCSFIYLSSVAALVLYGRSWVVAMETVWLTKPKIINAWLFTEKVCQSLI